MKVRTRKTSKLKSRKDGFSLVTVTIVGLLATMWLAATTSSMLQVYQSANQSRYSSLLLSAAESTLDNVLVQMNDPNIRPTIDPSYGKSKVVPNLLATQWGGSPDITVSATISNVAPTSASYLYDPTYLIKKNSGWDVISNVSFNPWRLVQVTASSQGVSKTITVALKSLASGLASQPMNGSGGSPSSQSSYFLKGMLTTDQLLLGNNTQTMGYDSVTRQTFTSSGSGSGSGSGDGGGNDGGGQSYNLGGDVGSLTSATLSGAVTIGGSLDVPSLTSSVSATGNSQAQVSRYVTTNGTQTGFSSLLQGGTSSNVFAASSSDFPPQIRTPILINQSNAQGTLPPAPTAPIDSSGNLASSVVTPAGGAMVYTSSGTIPRVDYNVNSVQVSSSASVSPSSSAAQQPVRVFVNGDSTTPIVIKGNVNSFGSPADFQIWYNGTSPIEIRSNFIRASVYAPNATVLLGGTSSLSHFYGSVVARQIGGSFDANGVLQPTKNLEFHADRALTTPSEFSGSTLGLNRKASLLYDPSKFNSSNIPFQVASYMESRSNH